METILFYKPYGVLCQFTDTQNNRSTLKDFIPIPELYPVGRLDYDSEGLLILTQNGRLQHHLAHPQFGHPRVYWAQVEGVAKEEQLEPLRRGLKIQNYHTRPARVAVLTPEPEVLPRVPPIRYRKNFPTSWLSLTLTEGRNRQVRRMTAAIGLPTLRLIRFAHQLGHGRPSWQLNLKGLEPGQWRPLSSSEEMMLKRFEF